VAFFVEIDLCVLLVLSPYLDGSRLPSATPEPKPSAVAITVLDHVADPLPWPYPDVPYPDLAPYLDETGARSDTVLELHRQS
jgi:hypothetical protein